MRFVIAAMLAACVGGCASSPDVMLVKSVEFLPEMAGEPARRAHVLAQDGALATSVPGGTLWTFGDTFMGMRDGAGKPQCTGALSNTMAFLPAGEMGWPPAVRYFSGADGLAVPPLPLAPGEDEKTRRLWPLAGVYVGDAAGGLTRAYMFYGLIEVTGPGPWGFKSVGTGLARAHEPFGAYERLHGPDGSFAGWPMDPTSIVRQGGWLYLFAPRKFNGEKDASSGMLVGRVREGHVEEATKYEFFAGLDGGGAARWVPRVEDATPAADGVWGQASVSWCDWLGCYLLATSSDFFHHDCVRLRRGPTPWGPFKPLPLESDEGDEQAKGGFIHVPELAGETTTLVYCTMIHPELGRPGEVVLTFCRMLKRDWAFNSPEGVRVRIGRFTAGGVPR